MTDHPTARVRWWLWLGLALTAFKFWLTRAQPIYAISGTALDDQLFLQLAESIVRGEWLGAYNQATLAKGCAYSLWIAATFWIGLPLGFAQQALYAAACAAFARACRPAIPSGAARLGIYLVLLWNPMSYEAPTLGRIIRQNLYTPLGVLIFAGWVALYCRRQENLRRQLPWAILLGLSSGLFWLTREESIWMLPSILLLGGAAWVGAWRVSRTAAAVMLRSGVVAVACFALPLLLVSWQNYRHYGWFGTVEVSSHEFKDAYGAMLRVKVGPELPQVPVTRQAREAMYAVSPSFAQLRPHLEGPVGDGWAEKELFPAAERQIRGGWFIWALRDSVARSGHAPDARTALLFYRQMAREINLACDEGRLPAGPHRSGLMPPWREGQTASVAHTFLNFAEFVASFTSFNVLPHLSDGDNDDLLIFRDLTRDDISSSVRSPAVPRRNQEALNHLKWTLLQDTGNAIGRALFVLFLVAHVMAFIRIIQLIRARQLTYPLVLAAAAWGGWVTYLLLNALVHVTSFPLTAVSTFAPIYPLLIIFIVAVIWDAAGAWLQKSPSPPFPS